MKHNENTVSELAFLFKLLPAMQELETVDKIYRLLLAVATAGRSTGFGRAMLFVADEAQQVMRGRYGVERDEDALDPEDPRGFEEMARVVFASFENIDSTDLTLKARTFSVPFGWHRSALIKAAKSGYPVRAEMGLSEFATDPFFEYFDSESYIAVPIKFSDRVTAVLAADRGSGRDLGSVDDISLLYSLAQQASAAAHNLMQSSESVRRSRILWKLHQTLTSSKTNKSVDDAMRLALVMLSRATRASGCFLKDYSQRKTIHIKTVREYSPEANDTDAAIGECFETVLDEVGGKIKIMSGDREHPFLNDVAAQSVRYFFACPLVASGDVTGAIAVYRENGDKATVLEPFDTEERRFVELCAGVMASRIELGQKEQRIKRIEEFLEEVSTNLARERERARIGDRSVELHTQISEDLGRLRKLLSSKAAQSKRLPQIAGIVKTMEAYVASYREKVLTKERHYSMVDLYALVAKVVEDWRVDAEKRGIEVSVRIPANGPRLLLVRERIRIAIANILKATASCLNEGDRVLIECSSTDDRVIVCIADTGTGLPGETISRLFMPFSEVEEHDERKRALSLAGEILQKHAGEIMIKSSVSWKTILVLSLPRAANRDRRKASRDRRNRADRRTRVPS